MTYRRKPITEPFGEYLERELEQIERELTLSDFLVLKQYYSEPSRLVEGLIVFADGTTWNPGSGKGIYAYYSGTWHKLG